MTSAVSSAVPNTVLFLVEYVNTQQVLAAIPSILIGIDMATRITWWNTTAEQTFGLAPSQVVGRPLQECGIPWDAPAILHGLASCRSTRARVSVDDVRFHPPGRKEGFLGISLTLMQSASGEDVGILLLGADITERKLMQSQLAQAQKLESIGLLAAGIAHEINTPIQYVGDNMLFLQESFQDLSTLLEHYAALYQVCRDGAPMAPVLGHIETTAAAIDVAYLTAEIPTAIQQSLEGVERVATIVRAMKEFSHPGTKEKVSVDLNKAIESTITVARNEWKYVAQMVTDLAPDLPLVPCVPGALNQVLLNILVNAAHALGDIVGDGTPDKGTMTVSTRQIGDGGGDPHRRYRAFHHCPSACPDQRFSALTAVHIANALVHTEDSTEAGGTAVALDSAYVAQLGLSERLSAWRPQPCRAV